MKFYFVAVFMFLAAVDGLIIGVILLLFSNKKAYNKKLLGISLFSYSWLCLVMAAIYSQTILAVPHLFRTGAPLLYLVAPTSYLYVRSTLSGDTRPRKYDWVHFIPFLFLTFELLPFYLKDAVYKTQVIKYYIANKANIVYLHEGFFGERVHYIIRPAIATLYIFFQWKVIIDFIKNAPVKLKAKYQALVNWLKLYTALITTTFCAMVLVTCFNLFFKTLGQIPNIFIALYLVVISVMLLFKPGVLYSFNENLVFVVNSTDIIAETQKHDQLHGRKCSIEDLLKNQHRYLVKNYNLAAMAAELGIPPHTLSLIINKEYQLSFTDLINKYRIEHIINNTDDKKMATLTFESIGLEAGFSSRTTFYRAFIKITGQTPSVYFKKAAAL
jgi:AraC-like DNA-binding protein